MSLSDTAANEAMTLASALVRLGREGGLTIERVRAEQLLRDARSAWPGPETVRWDRWLREACSSAELRSRVADLTPEQALKMAADGATLVSATDTSGVVTLLVSNHRGAARLATGEIDRQSAIKLSELKERLGLTGESGPDAITRWVIVDHPQLSDAEEARHLSKKPVRRFARLLRAEWSDIWIVLVFAFLAGVLTLATPIAVESLVNTVAFGRLLQPVVILAALLFGFLAFAGIMRGMQTYVVEIIQRRLFARVAADLAFRLPRVDHGASGDAYAPELVNRFLDVATLQKVSAQLLTDGIGIVLATLVGMTVLAFYHPWLLGFDVLLLGVVVAGLFVLGRGAISAAIKESKYKYKLAAWYEDVMRCSSGFKSHGAAEFANDRANELTSGYLSFRREGFGVLFQQLVFILGLQAIAGTVLLGGGGWLVIQGQLSLGQLVAAELIVATILGSLAKLGKHLEGFYDVVAAVDKLGVLFDLPVERLDGVLTLPAGEGMRVRFTSVRHAHGGPTLKGGLSDGIEAGQRVALYGPSGSGKSTLLKILFGEVRPASGHVEIEHSDPRDLRPDILRRHVAFAAEPEIFEGSIADNVHLCRPGITANDVRAALNDVGLLDATLNLPEGLETPLNASGRPLSLTQQRLLMLARAIAGAPRLLLIDGLLDSLPDAKRQRVLDQLTDADRGWTVVVATGQDAVASQLAWRIDLEGVDDTPVAAVSFAGGDQA